MHVKDVIVVRSGCTLEMADFDTLYSSLIVKECVCTELASPCFLSI